MGYGVYEMDMHPDLGEDLELTLAKSDFKWIKGIYKEQLETVTDEKLLNKILHEVGNKHIINNIVPNKRFQAYNIAQGLKKKGQALTTKQRSALINVFSHYLAS